MIVKLLLSHATNTLEGCKKQVFLLMDFLEKCLLTELILEWFQSIYKLMGCSHANDQQALTSDS